MERVCKNCGSTKAPMLWEDESTDQARHGFYCCDPMACGKRRNGSPLVKHLNRVAARREAAGVSGWDLL